MFFHLPIHVSQVHWLLRGPNPTQCDTEKHVVWEQGNSLTVLWWRCWAPPLLIKESGNSWGAGHMNRCTDSWTYSQTDANINHHTGSCLNVSKTQSYTHSISQHTKNTHTHIWLCGRPTAGCDGKHPAPPLTPHRPSLSHNDAPSTGALEDLTL